jgi:hypothetical protein
LLNDLARKVVMLDFFAGISGIEIDKKNVAIKHKVFFVVIVCKLL